MTQLGSPPIRRRLDRPYLWRSLQWQRAPHLVATMGPRAMVYLDWSLIFSAATVALVMVLAFVMILAPLGRMPAILPPLSRLSVAAYFTLLGLGYLLIEIAVLQRVILFTGQPVLAASIVFAIFLIGSGIGSVHGARSEDTPCGAADVCRGPESGSSLPRRRCG